MQLKNIMVYLVICLGVLGGLVTSATATPKANRNEAPDAVQGSKTIPEAPPPLEEHRINLHPFFLLQKKGPHVWLERVIVTVLMAAPKDSLKYDVNSPDFRKMIYDLLQSGKPETTVQEKAEASLHRQLKMNLEATVELSRSVIIVR